MYLNKSHVAFSVIQRMERNHHPLNNNVQQHQTAAITKSSSSNKQYYNHCRPTLHCYTLLLNACAFATVDGSNNGGGGSSNNSKINTKQELETAQIKAFEIAKSTIRQLCEGCRIGRISTDINNSKNDDDTDTGVATNTLLKPTSKQQGRRGGKDNSTSCNYHCHCKPNRITFGTFLKACHRLTAVPYSERVAAAKYAYTECCHFGQLDEFVVTQLTLLLSFDNYDQVFEQDIIRDARFPSFIAFPKEYSRNVPVKSTTVDTRGRLQ